MHLFFTPSIHGKYHELGEEESRHIVKSLRLSEGDAVELTDGKGGLFKAELKEVYQKKCLLAIKDKLDTGPRANYSLHVAIAPTKNIDRYEWFVEKATEIGIDEITPLLCFHSERKRIKPERLERIAVAAMKQSRKTWLPGINDFTKFMEIIKRDGYNKKFIAHCKKPNLPYLKDTCRQNESSLVLIGPEGDFSEEEINEARSIGFQEISLGNSRLRTETAGLVACQTINQLNLA